MNQSASHSYNAGFMVNHDRRAKADKIIKVLDETLGQRAKPIARRRLLDIGTGNGEIASHLSEFYDVVSVDITDQRTVYDGFQFFQLGGEQLPFSDRSFDVVVSNHVIEHVTDADHHLSEVGRVLKNDGMVYLATPNRFWPWEVHNKIPLLHYLPAAVLNRLLKSWGRHREDIFLLTWWALNRKAKKDFSVNIASDRICKWPLQYHMNCHPFVARILSWIPLRLYRMLTFIHPTLVVVLKTKEYPL
jgi:ubiquinone/menaquinone biosynthesis C-methylase UbiE